ncbi:MAG: CPBP family intramembrane metalloprotease [Myxococcales bacterium]|nr:CPBP family intramembrane metalloprotease [Myxococcales bacterium]
MRRPEPPAEQDAEPAEAGEPDVAAWRRDGLRIVVPVGLACMVWSHYYDALRLPPRIPYGTFGLTLGGDVLPMLIVPLLVTGALLRWPLARVGVAWPGLARTLGHAGVAWLLVMPFVVVFAQRPEFQATYPSPAFPPARQHAVGLIALWLIHHAPQMLSLEFCVRGFLLQPIARAAGIGPALLVTGAPYVWLHLAKPPLELFQAGWAAVVFGVVAWRTRSFWPAFLAHWAVAVSMDFLALAFAGAFSAR